ncbi:uncharacterized protein [Epargyreus clarus]|uniref:uncharacterized protein n=1 Tax=Epargyreus clarus TaxID=520877 RepID=UPI003C2EC35F
MSDITGVLALNLYDEELNEETTLDLASQELEILPNINNKLLCVVYLQNNKITVIPDDFFPTLPHLMWLDLRCNQLTEIPKSIKNHQSLTHLLLSNNKISSLPNELGTLKRLKVLQLSGNPLTYPPEGIVNAGIIKLLNFLQEKYIDDLFSQSQSVVSDENEASISSFRETSFSNDARSYNSVLDEEKLNKAKEPLSVQFSEKDIDSDEEYYTKIKGKCPKLPKSRLKTLTPHCQSAKYLKKVYTDDKDTQDEKIKQSFLKDLALKKHKNLLATRDKIIQGKKNIELLRNWQQSYRSKQLRMLHGGSSYKTDPKSYPYDTSPEYMTLLTREDIEKDLPDKYRKRLIRKSKPTIPRKSNNDVHLAMKIKQLFENLEAIDLNRETMTPRTEQKVLLGEIQKISEIKQKLMELSTTNTKSVIVD